MGLPTKATATAPAEVDQQAKTKMNTKAPRKTDAATAGVTVMEVDITESTTVHSPTQESTIKPPATVTPDPVEKDKHPKQLAKPKSTASPDRIARNRAESKSPADRPKRKQKVPEETNPTPTETKESPTQTPNSNPNTEANKEQTTGTTADDTTEQDTTGGTRLSRQSTLQPNGRLKSPPINITLVLGTGGNSRWLRRFPEASKHHKQEEVKPHAIPIFLATAKSLLCKFNQVTMDSPEAVAVETNPAKWSTFMHMVVDKTNGGVLSKEDKVWAYAMTVRLAKTRPNLLPGPQEMHGQHLTLEATPYNKMWAIASTLWGFPWTDECTTRQSPQQLKASKKKA